MVVNDIGYIIKRIIEIRKSKGYSMDVMSSELNISLSAYNKIEKMETKLSLERFIEICNILDSPISQFFRCQEKCHHINSMSQNNNVKFQTLYINSLKDEIQFLRQLNSNSSRIFNLNEN